MRSALRTAGGPAATGAGAGVLVWLFGVYPPDAALVGLLVAAALAVPAVVRPAGPAAWAQPAESGWRRGYYDVRRLASLLDTSERDHLEFTARLVPRLRGLAAARLERGGIRWDDAEARRLLGPEVYDRLADPAAAGGTRPPSAVGLTEQLLDRLGAVPDEEARTP